MRLKRGRGLCIRRLGVSLVPTPANKGILHKEFIILSKKFAGEENSRKEETTFGLDLESGNALVRRFPKPFHQSLGNIV